MQDRYVGDIGDFGKLALLKALNNQGFSLGVNWYKTEKLQFEKNPDGSYKAADGRYTEISEELAQCDPELAKELMHISQNDRTLKALEDAKLLSNVVYYNQVVSFDNRREWHKEALKFFDQNNVDLVFLDPDNGLLVPSVKENDQRSVKYAFYNEVVDYLKQGKSVLVYNHRSRKPELQYFNEIESRIRAELEKLELGHQPKILAISFPRYSIRDYFAVAVNPEHERKIQAAFSFMLTGVWVDPDIRMCQKPLIMDITYTEYRNRFKSVSAFKKNYQALPEEVVRDMIYRTEADTTVKACMFGEWKSK